MFNNLITLNFHLIDIKYDLIHMQHLHETALQSTVIVRKYSRYTFVIHLPLGHTVATLAGDMVAINCNRPQMFLIHIITNIW